LGRDLPFLALSEDCRSGGSQILESFGGRQIGVEGSRLVAGEPGGRANDR
jgi:hypothetical protein